MLVAGNQCILCIAPMIFSREEIYYQLIISIMKKPSKPGDMITKMNAKKSKGKNFIAGAIKKPGALRKTLAIKKGQKIPAKKLAMAAKKPGKEGQRARFAQTLKKLNKNKKY